MRVAQDEAAWEQYVRWLELDVKTVHKINGLVSWSKNTRGRHPLALASQKS